MINAKTNDRLKNLDWTRTIKKSTKCKTHKTFLNAGDINLTQNQTHEHQKRKKKAKHHDQTKEKNKTKE